MALLGYILIFLVLIVLVPLLTLVLWGMGKFIQIKNKLSGGSKSTYGGQSSAYGGGSSTYSSSSSTYGNSGNSTQKPHTGGKIIPDDEGEYVDFEEVK